MSLSISWTTEAPRGIHRPNGPTRLRQRGLGFRAEATIETHVADLAEAYPRIRRYVLSLVHDPAEAEDLTQEAFLRAHRQRDQLRDPKAQLSWLYRIATHVAVDRMRQRSRRQAAMPDAPLEPGEAGEPADDGPTLQQVIEQEEMTACVQSYVVGLPDTYRSVLLLSDMHDMSGPEIAQMLAVSLPTVKIRLHRARQKLRAALQAACEFSRDERNVLVCEPQALATEQRA